MILGLIGWAIVGGGIALAYSLHRETKEIKTFEDDNVSSKKELPFDENNFCNVLESISGAKAIIMDQGLKIVSIGKNAKELAGVPSGSTHLIDMVPKDIAAMFIEEIGKTRRKGVSSWECSWGDLHINVRAVTLPTNFVALGIWEKGALPPSLS